jgi:hypothetical protein
MKPSIIGYVRPQIFGKSVFVFSFTGGLDEIELGLTISLFMFDKSVADLGRVLAA